MKAKYHNFDNPDQLLAIQDLLEPLMFLIPCWVREVNVYSVSEMEQGLLATRLSPRYRYASFDVTPTFFDRDLETQRALFLHEFIHTLLGDFAPWVQTRLIDPVKAKNEDLYTVLQEDFTERLERVVQEFTYLLETVLPR